MAKEGISKKRLDRICIDLKDEILEGDFYGIVYEQSDPDYLVKRGLEEAAVTGDLDKALAMLLLAKVKRGHLQEQEEKGARGRNPRGHNKRTAVS